MKRTVLVVAALLLPTTSFAGDVDPRIGRITKIHIVAKDSLKDDQPVAACVLKHLPTALPMLTAVDVSEADATLQIEAKVYGDTSRSFGALIGGQDSVALGAVVTSLLIDGKTIWKDRTSVDAGSRNKRTMEDDQCSLADAAIGDLRKVLRKARDRK